MSEKRDTKHSGQAESERLERRYREATDPVLRTHFLMVWRMSLGQSPGEVALMVGYSERRTRQIERRYDSEGVEGLSDRRHRNPGARRRAFLIRRARPSLGRPLWGGTSGRGDMERAEGSALDSPEDGLGKGTPPAGLRVPEEGAHEPAGPQAIERQGGLFLRAGGFQKSLALKLEVLGEAHPEAEASLGLKPVMRRIWASVGRRPTARFETGYKWTYPKPQRSEG